MKVVIIGDGVAGQTAAEYLRKKDNSIEIEIYSSEIYSYYSRIYLPHYIAGERSLEKLVLRKKEWYVENRIKLSLDSEITKINPSGHQIWIKDNSEPVKYDKLIYAAGSQARKITFGKPNIQGLLTLRSIADADLINKYIQENHVQNVLIIGGGLLGIELGYHLRELQKNITICEIAPYLLPRQLDEKTAGFLQKYLQSKGLNILTGKSVQELLGSEKVEGVKLKDGSIIQSELILEQMGIIPEIQLAKNAGLSTDKGVIVNEFMQTSNPDIYAAGDCIQFNNNLWGIIPASLDQSKLAAQHILGEVVEPYVGTFWATRLKIAGIDLSCYGQPPDKEITDENIISMMDAAADLCRTVVIRDKKLVGAILLGKSDDQFFAKRMGKEVDPEEIRKKIEQE